jgi:titin
MIALAWMLFPSGRTEASPGATITVNSTADTDSRDGVLTVREAMLMTTGVLPVSDLDSGECAQVSKSTYGPPCSTTDAVGAASDDTVVFDSSVFPMDTPAAISLGSALPTLNTANDTVNGSGAGVIVDGVSKSFDCFVISGEGADGNVLRGLQIRGCSHGVTIDLGADSNTIGGTMATARNVISDNKYGVLIQGTETTGNLVQGNFIGTGADGTTALGNEWDGVVVFWAPGNTIGGTAPGARNIISGNKYYGVEIARGGPPGNEVQGNFIGTDVNGTAALGNGHAGVLISQGSRNTIGGTAPGARNIISGNGENVILSMTTGNHVQGNFIGTDVNGTASLGGGMGVSVGYATSNTIGGASAAARNVISGGWNGIVIEGGVGNLVQGNFIGTDVTGTLPLGNAWHGVWVHVDATDNTVGGLAVEERNIIAYNGRDGVRVSESATRASIRCNSIYSNGEKGIENIEGGNLELPPPVIDSVGPLVSGHTAPKCYPCTVEVFSDSDGEGRTYHGFTTTDDDATGTWTYTGTTTGPNITATITDAVGNTSEFSAPMPYSPLVGGIAELPAKAGSALEPAESSRGSSPPYAPIAGAAAVGALLLAGGVWYARRRWRAG